MTCPPLANSVGPRQLRPRVGAAVAFLAIGVALLLPLGATAPAVAAPLHQLAESSDDQQRTPCIVLLHSYHQHFSWSDSITRGVMQSIDAMSNTADLRIEYLDTRHLSTPEYFDEVERLLTFKYADVDVDVLIASDDHAFSFALERGERVFGDVPMVVCSVNGLDEAAIDGRPITGMKDNIDLQATIDVALKLHPKTERVVFVNDKSRTGIAIRAKFNAAIEGYVSDVEFEFLDGLPSEELQAHLAAIPKNSIVIPGLFGPDANGRVLSHEEHLRRLRAVCDVPIYGVWDFYLEHGIVGGKLTAGEVEGRRAANLAIRVLNGESAADIPLELSPTVYQFDWAELQRFNISEAALPEGSVIVNRPTSPFERYRFVIYIFLTVMVALIGFVIALLFTMAHRRRSAIALRDSERRFRLLAENVPGVIYLCRNDARYTMSYLNDAVEELTGYPKEDFLEDRISFVDLYHPADAEAITPIVEEALEQRKPFRLEYRIKHREGHWTWISESGVGVFDDTGELRFLEGFLEDITTRKRAAESQQFMMAELDHRVKNNLATVQSIVQLSRQSAGSSDEFQASLIGRIHAMAQAHDLFASHGWQEVPLRKLLNRTFAPYQSDGNTRVQISDCKILLPTTMSQKLAMVMHELATNAAKYGALSHPDGTISIDVREEDDHFEIFWTERGGPAVSAPDDEGFGMRMIRGVIDYELKGELTFVFSPEGLACRFVIPFPSSHGAARSS